MGIDNLDLNFFSFYIKGNWFTAETALHFVTWVIKVVLKACEVIEMLAVAVQSDNLMILFKLIGANRTVKLLI